MYRVLDLPPSMRPLVYDFGQLNREAESKYIEHIVRDHVKKKIDPSIGIISSVSRFRNILSYQYNSSKCQEVLLMC